MEDAIKKQIKQQVEDRLSDLGFTPKEWKDIIADDPTNKLLATSSWQNPANYATASTTVTEISELFKLSAVNDALPSDANWRDLQKQCYKYSNTFGPLKAAIDSKSDMVIGKGFSISSPVLEINEFIKDLFLHPRNKLYKKRTGWIKRMLSVGEMFTLISLDDFGNATIRSLDEARIGESDDSGLLTDPDDVTATLFYKYFGVAGEEWIPDARFIYESEIVLKERMKRLGDAFKKEKVANSQSSKHKAVGGYRRFIIHWKNLTGVEEILRDTSPVASTLEWINLYIQALKWQLDYKKALCAWTIVLEFQDSPAGKVAWHVWNKMSTEERDATGLTRPLSPGSKVWVMPGIKVEIKAPPLPKISGDNQDFINLSGAGARTPQDLWQGQSSGATYASLKMSRAPLNLEIENIQEKTQDFIVRELVMACGIARIKMTGGKFTGIDAIADPAGKGTEYTLLPVYPTVWVQDLVDGEISGQQDINAPFWESDLVVVEWPVLDLVDNPSDHANAALGSKHAGLLGLNISESTIAKKLNIHNIEKEKKKRALEKVRYGEPKTGSEVPGMNDPNATQDGSPEKSQPEKKKPKE